MYSRDELEGRGFGLHGVSILDHVEFRLKKNGHTLALRLWLPTQNPNAWDGFKTDPFQVYTESQHPSTQKSYPTVLEYIPYGKSSYTTERDHVRHPWLASHGFVVVRADMRGSGDSSGLYFDEYLQQEQDDACQLIGWISEQLWSNGSVGMYGKSWGGFNGLQVAACQPPALKAVISLYSTDDRFADDIHYKGGCVLGNGMLSWAAVMLTWNARPPNPRFNPDWKIEWRSRLEHTSNSWIDQWLVHQKPDSYWNQGSIAEDYSQVQIPVLAIGGWHDGYTNAVFRMVDKLPHCRGIIGPWSHDWPDVAVPGPQIGFMMECLDFWSHHLKGEISPRQLGAPKMTWYQCEGQVPPGPSVETWPGQWMEWKNPDMVKKQTFHGLNDFDLVKETSEEIQGKCFISSPKTLTFKGSSGLWCGEWLSFGAPDLPGDQSLANASDPTWKTRALTQHLPIFGLPAATVAGKTSEGFKGCIVVRMCDVFPDGKTRLISYGVKNISNDLHGDESFSVEIQLDALGYTVNPGHSLSMTFSTGFWPTIWPFPSRGEELASIWMQSADLTLPILEQPTGNPTNDSLNVPLYKLVPKFPFYGPSLEKRTLRPAKFERFLSMGLSSRENTIQMNNDEGLFLFPSMDMVMGEIERCRYSMSGDDPESCRAEVDHDLEYQYNVSQLSTQKVSIQTHCSMRADEATFYLENCLRVRLNEEPFFERKSTQEINRECV